MNIYVECRLVIYPYTVAVGTLHDKAVMTGGDVGKLCLVFCSDIVPFIVNVSEFIGISYEVIVLIVLFITVTSIGFAALSGVHR